MVKEEDENRLMELVGAVIKDCLEDLKLNPKAIETEASKKIYAYYSALAFFKDKESYFKLTGIDFEYLVRKYIKNKASANRALREYSKISDSVTEQGFHIISYTGIKEYLKVNADERIYSVLLWYLERAKKYHSEYYYMKKNWDKLENYNSHLETKLGKAEYNLKKQKYRICDLKREISDLKKELKECKK